MRLATGGGSSFKRRSEDLSVISLIFPFVLGLRFRAAHPASFGAVRIVARSLLLIVFLPLHPSSADRVRHRRIGYAAARVLSTRFRSGLMRRHNCIGASTVCLLTCFTTHNFLSMQRAERRLPWQVFRELLPPRKLPLYPQKDENPGDLPQVRLLQRLGGWG